MTAAAPASATRAARPRVPRREGVLGSLSITNSAATATRAAVRARGRISGAGKPGARPSINAAIAAVDRNPVAAPATTTRERIPPGRVTSRSASSGTCHATRRPLWCPPSSISRCLRIPPPGGSAAASLVPRSHSKYPADGRLASSSAARASCGVALTSANGSSDANPHHRQASTATATGSAARGFLAQADVAQEVKDRKAGFWSPLLRR
jgi:hypothetical protein